MPESAVNPVKGAKSAVPSADTLRAMRVMDLAALCPGAPAIMAAYGLHCFSCALGGVESLEEGCRMHGMTDEQLVALVEDLRDAFSSTPMRSATVTITTDAARGIKEIAEGEGKAGEGLAVIVDAQGGFSLEFRSQPEPGDSVFSNEQEPGVRVFVSPLTLARIGGATIDVRDGRFKLDLPDECGCESGGCGCQ